MATSAGVQLLGSRASPFSNRVQLALKQKFVEYEFGEEVLYVNKSERLLKANPVYQKIPVLIHDEKPVCESLVIVEYIDEAWTGNGPSILPSDPYERAIARFWAGYVDDKWFPTMKELLTALGDEAKAIVVGKVNEDFALLEEAFVKCSRDNSDVKLLDESRTPGLAGWAERFLSHDAVKDIIPKVPELLESMEKNRAARAAAANTAAD
ncbi:UNVERIFIED_CONTAM: Glutathione S-transferase U18 [Sesamum radiatum]|uniref:Glutathione S-transferase n=1 Tax=Sesamum radiatum TaxID=300843 RepID=A0AAW2MZK5_SESRA